MTLASNRRGFLAAGGAALAVPTSVAAGQTAQAKVEPYALPFTSVIPFTSAINGVAYQLYVRVPAGYAGGTARYPAIWLLDADYSFAIAAAHAEHLADRNHIPEQILIAIAYPGVAGNMTQYRTERTRDYTPKFWPTGGYGPEFQKYSGGGPAFARMIAEEAMPMIERQFRIDPARRTLVGHSYGGLFAAWMLQAHPELFDRYLVVSPSLWFADGWMLQRETTKDYRPLTRATRVWMGVGSWERNGSADMVGDLDRFATLLAGRGDPQLALTHRVLADETHASVFPAAFSTGLRHLYPTDWLAASTPADRGEVCVPSP